MVVPVLSNFNGKVIRFFFIFPFGWQGDHLLCSGPEGATESFPKLLFSARFGPNLVKRAKGELVSCNFWVLRGNEATGFHWRTKARHQVRSPGCWKHSKLGQPSISHSDRRRCPPKQGVSKGTGTSSRQGRCQRGVSASLRQIIALCSFTCLS